jgi:DNA-binding transcriptional LysR family regulator
LLDRNAQAVEPTAYGRALLDGGKAVFDDLRQAVNSIEFLADPTAGEVRIVTDYNLIPANFGTCGVRLGSAHPAHEPIAQTTTLPAGVLFAREAS